MKGDCKSEKCCEKKESPFVITVLGDYIKLANGSYLHLNECSAFDVNNGTSVMCCDFEANEALIYEAKTTDEAKNILDGLMKALAERKYYHMNAIVERLESIADTLREEL